jgi:5-methylcytosine-specific restriction endonuclease McrA
MLYACAVCGKPTTAKRCATHKLTPRQRGRSFEPTRQRIAQRDHWTCTICGKPINPLLKRPHPMALTIDHKTSRAAGGADTDSNYAATHEICNQRKGTS